MGRSRARAVLPAPPRAARARGVVGTAVFAIALVVAARVGYKPAGGVLFGFALLTPLERIFRRHNQPVRRPGLRTDVVHLLLTSALAPRRPWCR